MKLILNMNFLNDIQKHWYLYLYILVYPYSVNNGIYPYTLFALRITIRWWMSQRYTYILFNRIRIII